uniref:RRM domain-containing protein n=1 Tax=Ditylenchus dipsaci TaxID=166011 RepID=A0A915D2K2_9BILA
MDNEHGKGTPYQEPRKSGRLKMQDADHWQLTRQWILWYTSTTDEVGEGYKRVLEVETIHQFWALYAYIHRPQQLPDNSGYFFFKNGFPNEDSSSECCLIIYNGSISHGQASKINEYWQRSLIAVAGEQFGKFSSDVCGVSIAVKPSSRFQLILWVEMQNKSSLATYEKNSADEWLGKNQASESCGGVQDNCRSRRVRIVPSDPLIDGQIDKYRTGSIASSKPASSPVLIVQGFNSKKLSCQRIYNLFSSYGKCVRVFFLLRNNFSECHVEMGGGLDAARALQHLSGCLLDGSNLYIKSFFQNRVHQPKFPFEMPDKSPTFKDFSHFSAEEALMNLSHLSRKIHLKDCVSTMRLRVSKHYCVGAA